MTEVKGIFIKNIFHMMAYALQEYRLIEYADVSSEQYDDIHDLLSEILYRGVSLLLKRGLHKEYVPEQDTLTTLRGKLNLNGTMREYASQRRRLTCEYDEFSVDNAHNQIIKATMCFLLMHERVKVEHKHRLRKILPYFAEVSDVSMKIACRKPIRFDRNTQVYRILINLCRFVYDSSLLTTDEGKYRMPQLMEEQMHRLYEKFILEYYCRHRPDLHPCVKQIKWNIISEESTTDILPVMQTDVYLTDGKKTLIIDAKFYKETMKGRGEKMKVISSHLYQIQSYVMNEDVSQTGSVHGLLLYAKTSEDITPDGQIKTPHGNKILFNTLDLNTEFKNISTQLDNIADDIFGEKVL